MINDLYTARNTRDALKKVKEGYLPFAGGTEIMRLGSEVKSDKFVSLKNCGLNTIEIEGEFLKIGAMCTFTDLIKSPLVPEGLKQACRFNSSLQKRNMATIGGNIALHRDDSFLLSTLIAYSAEIELAGARGTRPLFILEDIDYTKEFITYVYLDPTLKVFSDRVANTEASHALVTAAVGGSEKGEFIIACCIKNTSIASMLSDPNTYIGFTDGLTFSSDVVYGSKEYKRYITTTTINSLVEKYEKAFGGNNEN